MILDVKEDCCIDVEFVVSCYDVVFVVVVFKLGYCSFEYWADSGTFIASLFQSLVKVVDVEGFIQVFAA